MILTALMELAEREGLVTDPHFEVKQVVYRIDVGPGGTFLGMRAIAEGAGKGGGLAERVPRPLPGSRRSGTMIDPSFLVDNASFVLGVNAPGDTEKKAYEPDELAARQRRFHALVHDAAGETGDDALIAVDKLLDDLVSRRQTISVPTYLKSNQLISFVYHPDIDQPVHTRPRVAAYWAHRRDASSSLPGSHGPFQCLITGKACLPVDKHPLVKKVPGGTPSGISFVSFNDQAFESYGWKRSENAPVSRAAADAYTEALKRLLDDAYPYPRHAGETLAIRNVRISDDTVVVFWSKGDDAAVDLFANAIGAGEPEAVRALYRATWRGRPLNLDDAAAFYALALSGGQGRGTMRGWLETTLGQVLRNVKQYFDDLKIAERADESRPHPLIGLLRQTAVQGKVQNIAPNLAAELFSAVLANQPFPRSMLDATIRRQRSERTVHADRFALIKAYLLRVRRAKRTCLQLPEVQPMLDESCRDPAYRLGRLFAVLEKVQQEATNASSTIRDRYYGAASATPIVVFPQLLRKNPHHLPKSQRPRFYEMLLQEVCEPLLPPTPFPHAMTLEQQGLFAVGYFHERQALFDTAYNEKRNARYFPKAPITPEITTSGD